MATPLKPSLLDRLGTLLLREPGDREQLVSLLHSAYQRNLLDADALSMIEGVLQFSEQQACDIMVPRAQMYAIDVREPPEKFIPRVIECGHSRFPVIGEGSDDIIGILLAKDLLRYYSAREKFDVHRMLRPAVFIPESKRLNDLLREFRANRNHMAIVVDEYGGVAGLVTIEDVIEQIVGEIEDEHDLEDAHDQVVEERPGVLRVKGLAALSDLDAALGTTFSDEHFDTVGGLVLARFGRPPKRGEQIEIDGLVVRVLRADSRRIHLLQVERAAPVPAPDPETATKPRSRSKGKAKQGSTPPGPKAR